MNASALASSSKPVARLRGSGVATITALHQREMLRAQRSCVHGPSREGPACTQISWALKCATLQVQELWGARSSIKRADQLSLSVSFG